jgi:hypothetical protein
MIPMSKSESDFLEKILTMKLEVVNYDKDNTIKFTPMKSMNKYESKFFYVPWSFAEDDKFMERAKDKGLGQLARSPFFIQNRLNEAKRNDRFKQLPVMAIGLDGNGQTYFYQLGEGNKFKNIRLSAVIRIPTRVKITSDEGNSYHVYSPFRTIQKYGMFDKNYSLKVLSWLVTKGVSDDMKEYFELMLKGMLITHSISPDYIVTMKSSKPLNESLINSLKKNDFFKDTKVIVIEKPDIKAIKKEYINGKYSDSEYFNLLKLDDDEPKMKNLSPEDRKTFAKIVKEIFNKEGKYNDIKGKNIILIDDLITTGSTFSNILIPLFEKDNKILPFAYLVK